MNSSVQQKPTISQGKFGGCTDLPDEEGTETLYPVNVTKVSHDKLHRSPR